MAGWLTTKKKNLSCEAVKGSSRFFIVVPPSAAFERVAACTPSVAHLSARGLPGLGPARLPFPSFSHLGLVPTVLWCPFFLLKILLLSLKLWFNALKNERLFLLGQKTLDFFLPQGKLCFRVLVCFKLYLECYGLFLILQSQPLWPSEREAWSCVWVCFTCYLRRAIMNGSPILFI